MDKEDAIYLSSIYLCNGILLSHKKVLPFVIMGLEGIMYAKSNKPDKDNFCMTSHI